MVNVDRGNMKTKMETKEISTALVGAHEAMMPAAMLLLETGEEELMQHGLELGSAAVTVGSWIDALLGELGIEFSCGRCGKPWGSPEKRNCIHCGSDDMGLFSN